MLLKEVKKNHLAIGFKNHLQQFVLRTAHTLFTMRFTLLKIILLLHSIKTKFMLGTGKVLIYHKNLKPLQRNRTQYNIMFYNNSSLVIHWRVVVKHDIVLSPVSLKW